VMCVLGVLCVVIMVDLFVVLCNTSVVLCTLFCFVCGVLFCMLC